jgi:hypothetical protein
MLPRLEAQLAKSDKTPKRTLAPDQLREAVKKELESLHPLLKSDIQRAKTEFRRLNLQLNWTPVEAEPRPHIHVKGQCDLAALALSVLMAAQRSGSGVGRYPVGSNP